MHGSLHPLDCGTCSWDATFSTFREQFYPQSENTTPEEYLVNLGVLETTYQEHGPGKGKRDAVTETAAKFMASCAGAGNGPAWFHQTEVVEGFCSHLQSDLPESRDGETRQARNVALVYEWENKPSQRTRQREKYPPPLTHDTLLAKLCRKRFVDHVSPPDEINADRRIIFINNLDPVIISILAKTTSRLETPVLQRTIFQHLTARTNFQVHIATRGFKTFSLELNVSYFCLRKDTTTLRDVDSRLGWDDSRPLRETIFSPDHPTEDNPATGQSTFRIYETQISVAVTGVDHYRWTAWGIVDDTWFEPGDTLSGYYEGPESGSQPDPLLAGQLDVDPPERDPRLYFLRIFEIRIGTVVREWEYILHALQEEIRRNGANPLFNCPERSFESKQGRDNIRKLATWNRAMIRLVGTLIKSLSQTLVAWEVFQTTDIGYFLDAGEDSDACLNDQKCASTSASTIIGGQGCTNQRLPSDKTDRTRSLLPSLHIIKKTFLNLHIIHEELEQLKINLEDLGRALAQGEKNYSTFVQQRTGEHIKLLTWVTIGWSPVMIATSMCSAKDGIFPFQNNIWDFFASLLVVSSLVGLTIMILLVRQGSSLLDWSIPVSSRTNAVSSDDSPDDDNIGVARGLQGRRKRTMSFVASAAETFTRNPGRGVENSGLSRKSTLVSRGWELGGLGSRSPTVKSIPRTYHPTGKGHGAYEPHMIV
ncbi:hypothetical protein QBC37DRAFT_388944 [Rhypophila decipiens]|uniref:Uncharacterized protein n=1 Tax=Rhypophila decipiens TaxID=261697 RepID=A0AAN6Y508_9PEZI|nr:hypothetical protein QBC37DRAFT_388944 [Rhypophila decipiens]